MKQYIVDAFTDTVFKGNPAAVCILDAWIPEGIMMKIAMENRFSETAFAVQEEAHTICAGLRQAGKSTSAVMPPLLRPMSYSIFIRRTRRKFAFKTLGGPSLCAATGILICMDFPSYSLMPVPVTDAMADAIGVRPERAYMGRDLVCILSDEVAVRNAKINQQQALDPKRIAPSHYGPREGL